MPLSLFQAYGVELEYMIVDDESLAVRPIADQVLEAAAGHITSDVELGEIAWSNELALHVIELKTNGPAPSLDPLADLFQQHVARINAFLASRGARLMPSAMHPWMDPDTELRLWPHDYNPVYEAYNRIFDCRGHGWANLQSVHLNLPFADDEEFGRLHAAIRLLLPILPALAASSPVVEGHPSGMQDTRMEVYRKNSQRIPSITGHVIPEPVYSRSEYERRIFQPMYADIAPFDPDKILQQEFLNSRGAIARFDRQTIEIRVLDVQECPLADVAICAAAAEVLKAMTDQNWTSTAEQQAMDVEPLSKILLATIRDADEARIDNRQYLAQFGYSGASATANELWRHLVESVVPQPSSWLEPLATILEHGPLSRRISRALGPQVTASGLEAVYRELCKCLAEGKMFNLHAARP
jgi:gamma-glutamyl:cysteine ligase YbdK (ATP-grasp superfamily)